MPNMNSAEFAREREQLEASIEHMASLTSIFFNKLVKDGVPLAEAAIISSEFVSVSVLGSSKNNNNNKE